MKRSAIQVIRDIFGIAVGLVAFVLTVSLLHALFAQIGVSETPTMDPQNDPEAWKTFMESLSTLELLSASFAHIGGTFVGGSVAMLIADSRRRFPGLILGALGLLAGIANAAMLPGQPMWIMVLDLSLYLPAGWLASEAVLRLKRRVA